MAIVTASWRLHRNAMLSTLRAILLSGTAACVLLFRLIYVGVSNGRLFYFSLLATLYVSACLGIIRRFSRVRGPSGAISICDGTLSVPRLILQRQTLHLREIKCIEYIRNAAGIILIVVVAKNDGTSVWIHRYTFDSGNDFDEFVQFVSEYTRRNHANPFAHSIAAVTRRRESSNSIPVVVLAIVLVGSYAALTDTVSGNIGESAGELGGLIRQTISTRQFYRVASSFFLHATPPHLLLNLISIGMLSWHVSVILGNVRLINVLFLSAISGAMLSLAFPSYDIIVGASGGISGLVGAWFFVCLKYQKQLPGTLAAPTTRLWIPLAVQIVFDVLNPDVSSCSHVGGFLFGCLYVGIISKTRTAADIATSSRGELWLATAVTLAFAGGFLHFLGLHFGVP